MTKNLKKCYHFMNLRYDASPDEVRVRQKIMLKVLRAKALKTKNFEDPKIKKVNLCAEAILANIELNGVPTQKILFDTSLENLSTLFSALTIIFVFAIVTFCLLI